MSNFPKYVIILFCNNNYDLIVDILKYIPANIFYLLHNEDASTAHKLFDNFSAVFTDHVSIIKCDETDPLDVNRKIKSIIMDNTDVDIINMHCYNHILTYVGCFLASRFPNKLSLFIKDQIFSVLPIAPITQRLTAIEDAIILNLYGEMSIKDIMGKIGKDHESKSDVASISHILLNLKTIGYIESRKDYIMYFRLTEMGKMYQRLLLEV